MWIAFFLLAHSSGAASSDACPVIKMEELRSEVVFERIRNPACNIKSVADALQILPKEFRDRYVIFHKSRSIQGPKRIILNGSTKFKLSITPDANAQGGNRMEMVDINTDGPSDDLEVFKYNEAAFPFGEKAAKSKSWKDVQAGVRTSPHANEKKCATCHGDPARPIYPGYPVWEGAVGGMEKGAGIITKEERAYLKQFIKEMDGGKNSRLNALSSDLLKRGGPQAAGAGIPALGLENETINGDLGSANAIRLARLLRKTPDYERFKFAIMAGLLECKNFQHFLPQSELDSLMATMNRRFNLEKDWTKLRVEQQLRAIYKHDHHFVIADYILEPTQARIVPAAELSQYPVKPPPDKKYPYDQFIEKFKGDYGSSPAMLRLYLDTIHAQGITRADPAQANLRLLMEGRGLNIDKWFLDLSQPTYRLQDGKGAAERTAQELIRLEATQDPVLKRYVYGDGTKELCKKLKELSIASLSGDGSRTEATACCTSPEAQSHAAAVLEKLPMPKRVHNLMADKCDDCHNPDYGHAPEIPFRSEQGFNQWLNRTGNRDKILFRLNTKDEKQRMPRTERLENEDRDLLIKYLSGQPQSARPSSANPSPHE
jgi:hypothetical protein